MSADVQMSSVDCELIDAQRAMIEALLETVDYYQRNGREAPDPEFECECSCCDCCDCCGPKTSPSVFNKRSAPDFAEEKSKLEWVEARWIASGGIA